MPFGRRVRIALVYRPFALATERDEWEQRPGDSKDPGETFPLLRAPQDCGVWLPRRARRRPAAWKTRLAESFLRPKRAAAWLAWTATSRLPHPETGFLREPPRRGL